MKSSLSSRSKQSHVGKQSMRTEFIIYYDERKSRAILLNIVFRGNI